ncbi:hypothetical protein AA19596_0370 [Acetobacter fabarum DSM 19596]|nr:hypothetical protein AA19596_0370 [Acetobacter fabarum DSM 19596]
MPLACRAQIIHSQHCGTYLRYSTRLAKWRNNNPHMRKTGGAKQAMLRNIRPTMQAGWRVKNPQPHLPKGAQLRHNARA